MNSLHSSTNLTASFRTESVKFSGRGKKFLTRAGLVMASLPLASGLVATSTAVAASPHASTQTRVVSANNGTLVDGRETYIDESAVPYVDHARDLPALDVGTTDSMIELSHHPLNSPFTESHIQEALDAWNAAGMGQIQMVIIPDTHKDNLAVLAEELGNQMGIGSDAQDDGVLILINANAVRENRASGRVFIALGGGLDRIISDAEVTASLRDNVLPYLNQGRYEDATSMTAAVAMDLLDRHYGDIPDTGYAESPSTSWQDDISPGDLIAFALLAGGASVARIYLTRQLNSKKAPKNGVQRFFEALKTELRASGDSSRRRPYRPSNWGIRGSNSSWLGTGSTSRSRKRSSGSSWSSKRSGSSSSNGSRSSSSRSRSSGRSRGGSFRGGGGGI